MPLNPATPASATVSWVSDDDNGFNSATPAQFWRAGQASGPWVAQGAAASARSFTVNTTQLGTLTVSNTNAPLPVALVAFIAEPQGLDALLKWTTASEQHNDYFDVEASADGQTFLHLGQVTGQGSSTQAHGYQFVDFAIAHYAAPLVYYRLRQVDTDGTFTYSPVRTVAVRLAAGLALFPNSTAEAAILTGAPAQAAVTVLDAIDRVMLTATLDAAGSAILQLPSALAVGVYVVRVGTTALRLTLSD